MIAVFILKEADCRDDSATVGWEQWRYCDQPNFCSANIPEKARCRTVKVDIGAYHVASDCPYQYPTRTSRNQNADDCTKIIIIPYGRFAYKFNAINEINVLNQQDKKNLFSKIKNQILEFEIISQEDINNEEIKVFIHPEIENMKANSINIAKLFQILKENPPAGYENFKFYPISGGNQIPLSLYPAPRKFNKNIPAIQDLIFELEKKYDNILKNDKARFYHEYPELAVLGIICQTIIQGGGQNDSLKKSLQAIQSKIFATGTEFEKHCSFVEGGHFSKLETSLSTLISSISTQTARNLLDAMKAFLAASVTTKFPEE